MKKIIVILLLVVSGYVSADPITERQTASNFTSEEQNKLVNALANQKLSDSEIYSRAYLIKNNDTLGALVLGLSGKKLGYGAKVKYNLVKETKHKMGKSFNDFTYGMKVSLQSIPRSGVVSDYDVIYPNLFIWISKDKTVFISNDVPDDKQILVLDKEEKGVKLENNATYFMY